MASSVPVSVVHDGFSDPTTSLAQRSTGRASVSIVLYAAVTAWTGCGVAVGCSSL
jgi:hypothetical protein